MPATTSPLLEASGLVKTYGAVLALRNASLSLRPGEVHALMGANGAGKSTLVKILTGAIRPTAGRIVIRGEERKVRSPDDARRAGLVSVYQEPSLIPDLDVLSNLRLTRTPVEPFRHWVNELGVPDLSLDDMARDVPLAILRVLDLARAIAIEPDVLLLDEMTAALPANLAEKVLEVVRRQTETGRSVIFISHRFLEISALCDRATILRDGETVGVVDIGPDVEDRIVELMLGERIVRKHGAAVAAEDRPQAAGKVRISVRNLRVGNKLNDVSFDLHDGEVAGIVALEGQGQDELFAALAGSIRPSEGTIEVDGEAVKFGEPRDAIDKGIAYVPGDRSDALLMHRSVRENIALPFSAGPRRWGQINMGRERSTVLSAIERLQIDTRAQGEVRRLSGGNQQKVTIARWIAADARTILCFDPTRGIDVRTKTQIYALVRQLAAQGKSVLYYTSELEEIQLVCDRAIAIFGGRIVDVLPVAIADEVALTRAAYGLARDAVADVGILADANRPGGPAMIGFSRRQSWVIGLVVLFILLFIVTRLIQPSYGANDFASLTQAALPYAFAVAAQAVVVLAGGIDLSIAAMMAVTSVAAAVLMKDSGAGSALYAVPLVIAFGFLLGALNGALIIVTRVPDIVVTLAMLFVLQGVALLILPSPGGGAADWLKALVVGSLSIPGVPDSISAWVPHALVLLVIAICVVWIPLRRSRLGLGIYAIGSSELAAFRSGVPVARTRILAYGLGGIFAALGGLTLTMSTGIGAPIPGPYLLASVAAVVLGGVALSGGRGGLVGPIVAVFVLRLVRTDLTLLSVDPNVTTIIEGVIMVVVVMLGALLALRARST